MSHSLEIILQGFPGKTNLGFLGLSTVILIKGSKTALFDTGAFGCRRMLRERLAECGVEFGEVEAVILSHLHFDHCHNALLFPSAQFYVHDIEVDHALSAGDAALYPLDVVRAIVDSGRLTRVKSDGDLWPGVSTILTPGHSPGSMSVRLTSEGRVVVLAGDAVKNLSEMLTLDAELVVDREASARSIELLRGSCDTLIPGHDSPIDAKAGRRIHPLELTLLLAKGVLSSDGRTEVAVAVS